MTAALTTMPRLSAAKLAETREPKPFTATPHSFSCRCCGHTVYASKESIEQTRRDCGWGARTDAAIAATFQLCWQCVAGMPFSEHEMHTPNCAKCAEQMRDESEPVVEYHTFDRVRVISGRVYRRRTGIVRGYRDDSVCVWIGGIEGGARDVWFRREDLEMVEQGPAPRGDLEAPRSAYRDLIVAALERQSLGNLDPRHVEAWIRVEHPTLFALDDEQFEREVAIAAACAIEQPTATSEALARTYGL